MSYYVISLILALLILLLFVGDCREASEEEIGGLKELFKMLDTDNSGTITFEELKEGLRRVGSELMESEIKDLMDAVRILLTMFLCLRDIST